MHKADKLPPSCAVVTKSGNFNFKEPSGPVQAVKGLLYLCFYVHLLVLLPYLTTVMTSFSVHLLSSAAVISICTTLFLLEMVQRIKSEEPLKIHFMYGFETKNIWLLQRNTRMISWPRIATTKTRRRHTAL